MGRMKILFLGTPEFAAINLIALHSSPELEILGAITQPDKPVGRKKILTAPPVKTAALELGLKVFQPENKQELLEILQKNKVDFLVVIAYGMILSKDMLKTARIAAINVHPSLLPKYRGASPIHETLLNGDSITGISIMKMTEKMDEGDIYLIKRLEIDEDDDVETLFQKLANLSAQFLFLTLEDIANGELSPIAQNSEKASYCHKIKKEDGKIDFQKTAEQIKNNWRAYKTWPGIYTELKGKKIKILELEISNEQLPPGKFQIDGNILKIGTAENILLPKKLQLEGKTALSVEEFINGNRDLVA